VTTPPDQPLIPTGDDLLALPTAGLALTVDVRDHRKRLIDISPTGYREMITIVDAMTFIVAARRPRLCKLGSIAMSPARNLLHHCSLQTRFPIP